MVEYYIKHLKFVAPEESKVFLDELTDVFSSPTSTDLFINTNNLVQRCANDRALFRSLFSFLIGGSFWVNKKTGYASSVEAFTVAFPDSVVWVELFDQWRQFHPEVDCKMLDRRIFFAAFTFTQVANIVQGVIEESPDFDFDLAYSEVTRIVVHDKLKNLEFLFNSSNWNFLKDVEVLDPELRLESSREVNLDPTGFEYRFFLESLTSFWKFVKEPNARRLEDDFEFRERVTSLFSDSEGYIPQLLVPYGRPSSEDFEEYYLPEGERNSYLPNPTADARPQLSDGSALVPSNQNNYQAKVGIDPLLDSNTLIYTKTSASVEFLHEETILDHFLSTYIDKFDLLSQITWNGVWGFFVTIVKFIYGLHKLHFFFLFQKVKIKKLMKWWGKKFK